MGNVRRKEPKLDYLHFRFVGHLALIIYTQLNLAERRFELYGQGIYQGCIAIPRGDIFEPTSIKFFGTNPTPTMMFFTDVIAITALLALLHWTYKKIYSKTKLTKGFLAFSVPICDIMFFVLHINYAFFSGSIWNLAGKLAGQAYFDNQENTKLVSNSVYACLRDLKVSVPESGTETLSIFTKLTLTATMIHLLFNFFIHLGFKKFPPTSTPNVETAGTRPHLKCR